MAKELFRRFLVWFMSGFGLAIGIFGAMLIADLVKPAFHNGPELTAKNQGELKVSLIEPLKITNVAGAVVGIKSTSAAPLRPVDIELVFKHEGKVLFWCSQYVSRTVPPGKEIVEQMLCDKVERKLLPEGTEYVVNIKSFEQWK